MALTMNEQIIDEGQTKWSIWQTKDMVLGQTKDMSMSLSRHHNFSELSSPTYKEHNSTNFFITTSTCSYNVSHHISCQWSLMKCTEDSFHLRKHTKEIEKSAQSLSVYWLTLCIYENFIVILNYQLISAVSYCRIITGGGSHSWWVEVQLCISWATQYFISSTVSISWASLPHCSTLYTHS